MSDSELKTSRALRLSLAAAAVTPLLLGILVAVRDPFGQMGTRELISLWVEVEVLVLVLVAVLAGHARARSERRRERAIREVRRRAVRDPLTALLNRRGLVSVLSRYDWSGEDGGCSALLLDLDDFKQVNDRYGHITGDRVLVAVADYLQGLSARGWIAARLGGDEFLMLRRGTELGERTARKITDPIPAVLREVGLPVVEASYGRAIDVTGSEPLDWLLARADRELNRARGKGQDPESALRFLESIDEDGSSLLARGQELSSGGRSDRPGIVGSLRALRRVGLFSSGLALLLALAALASIPLDFHWLRTVDPQGATAFTTSATLSLAALTMVVFFSRLPPSRGRLKLCRAAGWLIAAIGATVVLEHTTGRMLLPMGMISDPLEGTVDHIWRSDFETGLGFLFGGLYTTQLRRTGRYVEIFRAVVSFSLIAVIAAAAFGILLDAGYLWQGPAVALSPHGMVAGTLLAVALLVAEPRQLLLRPFLSGGGAARIAHTLVIAGVFMPLIAGTTLVHLDFEQGLGWEVMVMAVAAVQAAIMAMLAFVSLRAVGEADRETSRVWRELSEVADRDPLTGLFNRERFNREIALSRKVLDRDGHPYSVVLLDLDRLKELNSSHGYAAGDRALRTVAAALQSSVRPSDLPVRLGGDEFGILLPGADTSEAAAVALRCIKRIEEIDEMPLRASWGAATDSGEYETAEDLIEAADSQLYRAKESKGQEQAI